MNIDANNAGVGMSGDERAIRHLQTYWTKAQLEQAVKTYPRPYRPEPGDLFAVANPNSPGYLDGSFFLCMLVDEDETDFYAHAHEIGVAPTLGEPKWCFSDQCFTFTKVTL